MVQGGTSNYWVYIKINHGFMDQWRSKAFWKKKLTKSVRAISTAIIDHPVWWGKSSNSFLATIPQNTATGRTIRNIDINIDFTSGPKISLPPQRNTWRKNWTTNSESGREQSNALLNSKNSIIQKQHSVESCSIYTQLTKLYNFSLCIFRVNSVFGDTENSDR